MRTFAGIEEKYAGAEKAAVHLLSIPYDGTSTWGKGADKGFEAFLEAAENMELYDIETESEVYLKGIHILPELEESRSPEAVYKAVLDKVSILLESNKFLSFFGGEHAVSIGIIEAYKRKFDNLSVLQLDAHADLRSEYLGTPYNHACALHAASKITNLVQVGIRSMDSCELEHMNMEKCFFAEAIHDQTDWMQKSIDLFGDDVYLTIDLDVLDPSIMPDTGTPEPGGLTWHTLLQYLRLLFSQKNVLGFDIVEFAPTSGLKSTAFLVAKLYYKILSYKFAYGK